MIYTDEDIWNARQNAIQECIEDLAEALHTDSRNWQQLVEMASLYREIHEAAQRG